jgi:hypothetical protein
MSKIIQLTQGKVAIIDDEDFERVNKYKWCWAGGYRRNYAVTRIGKNNPDYKQGYYLLMHRLVMKTSRDLHVDHIDGNGLNNQKINLRNCTRGQNAANTKIRKNNTSSFTGVSQVHEKLFCAGIFYNGKRFHLGYFPDASSAAFAYNKAAKLYFGEFAKLNDIDPNFTPVNRTVGDSNQTGFRGVHKTKSSRFQVMLSNKRIGTFDSAVEAAFIYNQSAKEKFGHKAKLNDLTGYDINLFIGSKRRKPILTSKNTSGMRGVSFNKQKQKYCARCQKEYLGSYLDIFDAATAYNKRAYEIWGEDAILNIIPD